MQKAVKNLLPEEILDGEEAYAGHRTAEPEEKEYNIKELEKAMWTAVEKLDFERAAELRDLIQELRGGEKLETVHKHKGRKAKQFKKHRR